MDRALLQTALDTLNAGQQAAVDHLLGGWRAMNGNARLTIVDGPPGTGKTRVAAVAGARWVVENDRRVVVLSPTHAAADRVQETFLDIGFDRDQVIRLSPGAPSYDQNTGVLRFDRLDQLPPNLRRLRQQADVLITTWQGAQARAFEGLSGFLLLVDEVSQVSFAAMLAIMKRVRNCRPAGYGLLGDPQQLPVIATQEVLATNAALGILRRHPECQACRLTSQYRMNAAICSVVNEVRRVGFGGDPLHPGNPEVAERTLEGATGRYDPNESPLAEILNSNASVVFVDTSRFVSEGIEEERAVGTSWEYAPEARLAARLALAVQQAYGVGNLPTLAVSSPYAAQVALMRRLGAPNAITIYRAQGHEWDCVILSLARTTGRTIMDEVYQNLYVGLSRAKSKLIVLLNSDLFSPYRVFGSILRLAGNVPGVRLVTASPDWVTS
jgi:hypothetical protein